MDGIDNPPFFRRFFTNNINTFLDAIYIVPRRLGRVSMRLPKARRPARRSTSSGRRTSRSERLDPALTRPGRMGRHVWFRTPTKDDRKDIFDLYLDKVAHDPELDTPERRDEIARITNGYSPAMIEQICSMALTNAHHEGQAAFAWQHLVDAMTVVESGSASRRRPTTNRTPARSRSTRPGTPPLRTSTGPNSSRAASRSGCAAARSATTSPTKRRSDSALPEPGLRRPHHDGRRDGRRVVFYGENSVGVERRSRRSTARAATRMVGIAGMSPLAVELDGETFADETEERRGSGSEAVRGHRRCA